MAYASPFEPYRSGNALFGREFLEVEPQSSYQLWTGAQGASPLQPSTRGMFDYGKGLYDYFRNDYYSTAAKEPGLYWSDYLDRLSGQGRGVSDIWSGLAPSQRGENPGRFSTPVKWKTDWPRTF